MSGIDSLEPDSESELSTEAQYRATLVKEMAMAYNGLRAALNALGYGAEERAEAAQQIVGHMTPHIAASVGRELGIEQEKEPGRGSGFVGRV